MSLTTYRFAEPFDADALHELLLEMHAEMSFFPLAEEKGHAKIVEVLERGVCLLCEYDGLLIGSIGLLPVQLWYTESYMMTDAWTFVKREHRKSRVAIEMLKRIKAFCARAGLPLAMAVVSPHEAERKNTLYRRYLKPVGEMYMEFPDGWPLRQR
jgi:predicted N-acetyltransferase YhbS